MPAPHRGSPCRCCRRLRSPATRSLGRVPSGIPIRCALRARVRCGFWSRVCRVRVLRFRPHCCRLSASRCSRRRATSGTGRGAVPEECCPQGRCISRPAASPGLRICVPESPARPCSRRGLRISALRRAPRPNRALRVRDCLRSGRPAGRISVPGRRHRVSWIKA